MEKQIATELKNDLAALDTHTLNLLGTHMARFADGDCGCWMHNPRLDRTYAGVYEAQEYRYEYTNEQILRWCAHDSNCAAVQFEPNSSKKKWQAIRKDNRRYTSWGWGGTAYTGDTKVCGKLDKPSRLKTTAKYNSRYKRQCWYKIKK